MTPADFRALQPLFAGVGDIDIQRWIDRSDPYFDTGRWGALYSDGLSLWIAHKLVVEKTAAALPVVPIIGSLATSKKVGSESIAYSDAMLASIIKEPMNATSFGREYVELRDEVGMGAIATPLAFQVGPGGCL